MGIKHLITIKKLFQEQQYNILTKGKVRVLLGVNDATVIEAIEYLVDEGIIEQCKKGFRLKHRMESESGIVFEKKSE